MTRSSPRHRFLAEAFSHPVAARAAALLLVCLSGFSTLAARAAPAPVEPTFFIETIQIEGVSWASPELIAAETLLLEGSEYGERELRQAMFRVQRLPFVLDATFRIEKGSERGRYSLVIQVEEIKRWFFGEDTVFTRFTNSVAFDNPLADEWVLSPGPLAGVRLFLGRYNVLFGSVAGDRGLQAGYTRYNLFDRRVVLNLGLTADGCCQVRVFSLGLDPTFSSWQNEGDFRQARLSMGVPLGGQTSLQFQVSTTYSERGERRNLLGAGSSSLPRGTLNYRDFHQDMAGLSLIYDTTDDPVFPSRGLALTATFEVERLESRLSVPEFGFLFASRAIELPPGIDSDLPTYESSQWRLGGTLSQHWPLGRRHTLTLSARLAAGQSTVHQLPVVEARACEPLDVGCLPNVLRLVEDADLDVFESHFTVGLSTDLWGQRLTREKGDLRLETSLEFGFDRATPTLGLPGNPLHRKGFTTSVVFRNTWGLFRLSFQILDLGRGF